MLIGGHVSTAGGLVRALERAEELGCETMQIFNQSPRAWRPHALHEADFAAFRERARGQPVQVDSVYIHAVYLINVASDDAEVRRKSLESLTHALRVGDAIGAGGVIVHPGSGKGAASRHADVQEAREAMKAALAATESCPLLFENTAGAGFTIGRTFEELAAVIEVSGGDDAHRHLPRLVPPAGLGLRGARRGGVRERGRRLRPRGRPRARCARCT